MEQRKKFTAALSLFLVCVILMLYTSYAWLVVSSAPEVRNIETNVGANGSLEIALLNDETYIDPATIRTGVGDSLMAQDPMVSNTTWGNVIDLSAEEYGLQEISLKPSRLNVQTDADGNYVVGDHLLMMADFGADGRVSFISDNMVSGVFAEEKFFFHSEQQTHGVRGIGVAGELSLRQKAYTSAKSLVPMFQASALRSAQNIWQENGPALMNMWEQRMKEMENIGGWNMGYTEVEFAAILDSGRKLLEAYDYVDKGICQAVVGITSAMPVIEDSDFERIYHQASAPNVDAFGLYRNYIRPMGVLPEEFYDALQGLDTARDALAGLIRDCQNTAVGQDGYYHNTSADNILWSIGFWGGYLNGFDVQPYETEAYENLQEDNVLILHGANALTAFTGNYTASFTWGKRLVEVSTADALESAYLPVLPYLNDRLKALNMTNDPQQADIYDLYGFVIDMAFRCNTTTDLLLQTEQTLRVRETTELPVTQGGGSYLRFRAEDMTTQQLVELMDTIRLGFVDNRGYLVALAKPNVSNYKEDIDESVTAPLYLYEFTVTSDGVIVPGERRSEDTGILPLTQSSPEHLSAIVWMDGDYIDNSMASTVSEGMTGVVNLQFASSADLIPAFAAGSSTVPDDSVEPSEPGTSTTPTEPGTPTVPTEPGTPTIPTEPSTPTVPIEPSTPTTPTEPSTPTVPAEPGEVVEYELYIADTRVTSANAADILGDGTVSYDAQSNTLTLNGAYIEGKSIPVITGTQSIYSYAEEGLNIVLGEQESILHGDSSMAIEVHGPLTISGGSLTIQGSCGAGIYSNQNDITVDCAHLVIHAKQHALLTGSVGGTIYINGGKVELYGGENNIKGNQSHGFASLRTVLGNRAHVIAAGTTSASYAVPELAPGASGKSRTSASRDFVSGIFYNKENYFEFAGSGSGADIPSGTISVVDSGKITDEIYWAAYSDETLHISGSGAIPDDFSFRGYLDYIWVEIDEGITVLGRKNLTYDYQWITIPESLVCIGAENGWEGMSYIGRLKKVTYAGSPRQWEAIALIDPQLNVLLVQGTVTTAKENAPLYRSGTIPSTNMTWSLYEDGILIIDGSGEMPDWTETNGSPWSSYKSSIKAVIISDGITKIGAYAFYNHSELKAVTIPGGAHSIHAYAFADCENLLGVSMGENSRMQTLGENCFMGCSKLQCIGTMEDLTTVGDGAFRQCTSLTDIPQAKDS